MTADLLRCLDCGRVLPPYSGVGRPRKFCEPSALGDCRANFRRKRRPRITVPVEQLERVTQMLKDSHTEV